MEQAEVLVGLRNAGVRRDGRWLVRAVDLSVSRGEIVTLIGPNGSGKSTSAKMALGILTPDEGDSVRQAGLKIGYVPQKLAIDWTLPLDVRRFMRLTGPVDRSDIERALAATNTSKLINSQVRSLSGGEFQRVLLARAMARNPDFLVLDEPVQGVDFAGEIAIYDLISQIRDELGCGVLLISHDLHVVMAATDRVICLNGHICCQGTPRHVLASPEFRTLFGAATTSTLAVYEHNHDHAHLPDGRVRLADGRIVDGHDQVEADHAG